MLKLVDRLASEASARKSVRVRISLGAKSKILPTDNSQPSTHNFFLFVFPISNKFQISNF